MRLRWDSNPQPLNHNASECLEVQCAIHCATEPPVALEGEVSICSQSPVSRARIYQELANQRSYHLPRIGQSALVSSTKNWPISDRISLLLRRMTSWPFERQSALVLLPKNYFTSVFFDLRVTLEIYENLHTFRLITSLHFTSYEHFRGKSVLSSYFQYK